MKISVCMIVKNEEDQLRNALRTIPIEWEIIVVDTGSTDKTIELAMEFGAKVYHYKWNENFAAARNEAVSHATGDYILVLDADEQLSECVGQQVEEFIKDYPSEAGAVLIENFLRDEVAVSRMIRFFPNQPEYRFVGNVHERLCRNHAELGMIKCPIRIKHYGYQPHIYSNKGKYERYVHLYKSELNVNPNNGYMLYQLGKLYYSNKSYHNAYEAFVACLQLEQFDRLYFPSMLVQLGYTLKELGRSQQAIELLKNIISMYPKYPDIAFLLGILSLECGDLPNIEKYYKLALKIGDTEHYSSIVGNGSFRAAHNLAVFYEVTGQLYQALKYYEIAASYEFKPSISRLLEVSKKTK